jgi:hypothetical protein
VFLCSVRSKVAPDESKGAPDESKGFPIKSKGDPDESKGFPIRSKGDPDESKGCPDESKVAPVKSKGEKKCQNLHRGGLILPLFLLFGARVSTFGVGFKGIADFLSSGKGTAT